MEKILDVYTRNGVTIGTFNGNNTFYLNFSQTIKEQIYSQLSTMSEKTFILDMEGINHFDSSTFGCLVASFRTAKKFDKLFVLCNLSDKFMKVMEVIHLDKVFTIYSTLGRYFEV